MKFLIRDDDTCAFTDPEEIAAAYSSIWDHIPINLSVTPFRIPGLDKNVPIKYRNCTKELPLETNKNLISFLKEKQKDNKINIAMHGYNHTRPHGLPEYIGAENLFEKTRKGKNYLERILDCQIDTFVPPNNGIKKNGIKAIRTNRMNLIGMPSFVRPGYRPYEIRNLKYFYLSQYYRKLKKINYPYLALLKKHKECCYYSITPSQNFNFLKSALYKSNELNGIFILSVHYHAFSKKMKSGEKIGTAVNRLIEQSLEYDDVQYINYRNLWQVRP